MKRSAKWAARALRVAFRFLPSTPRELTLAGADIEPTSLVVATRHGPVRCDVYRSVIDERHDERPPIYVNFHGGAFIVREPRQDEHVCRFIASTTGAVVVNVDYDTAPTVQYPVAEQEAMDVVRWLRLHGDVLGWNADEIVVGGFSAGAKLAVNVCQQMRDAREAMPVGLVVCYPALNMTLEPAARAASGTKTGDPDAPGPAVAPWLIALMYETYFADPACRGDRLASPELDDDLAAFPPTLVLTGGLDAVGPEAERFARALALRGVDVRHRRFEDSDHGMTHNVPSDVARSALEMIAEHVCQTIAADLSAPSPDREVHHA
jgi:acetyl esterase